MKEIIKNISLIFYYVLMAFFLIFGLWYWIKAPCSFIKDFMWGIGEVPARCLIVK